MPPAAPGEPRTLLKGSQETPSVLRLVCCRVSAAVTHEPRSMLRKVVAGGLALHAAGEGAGVAAHRPDIEGLRRGAASAISPPVTLHLRGGGKDKDMHKWVMKQVSHNQDGGRFGLRSPRWATDNTLRRAMCACVCANRAGLARQPRRWETKCCRRRL